MTDATTVSRTASLHNGGVSPSQPRGITDLPREVDVPPTITPAVISEPVETRQTEPIVGPQSAGTSIGIDMLAIRFKLNFITFENFLLFNMIACRISAFSI